MPTQGQADDAERTLSALGRIGLAGQTAFFAVLTALTVRVAVLGGASRQQADAHGALALVSRPTIGKVGIAVVAAGLLLFGVARIVGATRDHDASAWSRVSAALQGGFYAALTYVPVSYLAGDRSAGSQQQQHRTAAQVLGMPLGRALLVAVGIIVVAVSVAQVRIAARRDFEDGLDLARMPTPVRRVTGVAGVVGITARALVFFPIGVFLVVTAVLDRPGDAYGTDQELLSLSGHSWGVAVLAAVAAGLATFVVYSAIQTVYRDVVSAE